MDTRVSWATSRMSWYVDINNTSVSAHTLPNANQTSNPGFLSFQGNAPRKILPCQYVVMISTGTSTGWDPRIKTRMLLRSTRSYDMRSQTKRLNAQTSIVLYSHFQRLMFSRHYGVLGAESKAWGLDLAKYSKVRGAPSRQLHIMFIDTPTSQPPTLQFTHRSHSFARLLIVEAKCSRANSRLRVQGCTRCLTHVSLLLFEQSLCFSEVNLRHDGRIRTFQLADDERQ